MLEAFDSYMFKQGAIVVTTKESKQLLRFYSAFKTTTLLFVVQHLQDW